MGPYLLQFNLMGVHPGHTAKSLLFLKTQGQSGNFFYRRKAFSCFLFAEIAFCLHGIYILLILAG